MFTETYQLRRYPHSIKQGHRIPDLPQEVKLDLAFCVYFASDILSHGQVHAAMKSLYPDVQLSVLDVAAVYYTILRQNVEEQQALRDWAGNLECDEKYQRLRRMIMYAL